MGDFIPGNAVLVLPDRLTPGAVVVAGGKIAEIRAGTDLPPGALDCRGDFLPPGMIELHTDNLDRHTEQHP